MKHLCLLYYSNIWQLLFFIFVKPTPNHSEINTEFFHKFTLQKLGKISNIIFYFEKTFNIHSVYLKINFPFRSFSLMCQLFFFFSSYLYLSLALSLSLSLSHTQLPLPQQRRQLNRKMN